MEIYVQHVEHYHDGKDCLMAVVVEHQVEGEKPVYAVVVRGPRVSDKKVVALFREYAFASTYADGAVRMLRWLNEP